MKKQDKSTYEIKASLTFNNQLSLQTDVCKAYLLHVKMNKSVTSNWHQSPEVKESLAVTLIMSQQTKVRKWK